MNEILCMVRYVIYFNRFFFCKKYVCDILEMDERYLFKKGLIGGILRVVIFDFY